MKNLLIISFMCILTGSCSLSGSEPGWKISVIPASIRLDPVTNEIIDYKFDAVTRVNFEDKDLLDKNWIFDGNKVTLHAARGEYISFLISETYIVP